MAKVSDLSPEQRAIRLASKRAAQKRYMERLTPEKKAAKALVTARWVAANREKLKERSRRYAKAHPDRMKASQDKYRKKKRLERLAPVTGVTFRTRLGQNELYAAADKYVSATLPTDVRDDAIQAIVLAVLEGEFSQGNIADNAKRYVDGAWGWMYREAYSLDETVPGGEKLRWVDLLTSDTPHV